MVACVVVNWNGWSDTLACLATLKRQTWQPLHVFVVDNGSTNDSVAHLQRFIDENREGPTQFTLLVSERNTGFAGGSNIGIREGLRQNAQFVWLLNNDTECPPDTLEKLVRTAEANPDTGAVGTVLYYQSDPERVQAWGGGRVNLWLGTTAHYYTPHPFARGSYLTFASVLIRAQIFQEVGLLDEAYFMYYDDSDFCMRMAAAGWRLAVSQDTRVLHKESASTAERRNPEMEQVVAQSGLLFLKRHSPFPAFSVPAFVALKLFNRLWMGEWNAFRAVLTAVVLGKGRGRSQ